MADKVYKTIDSALENEYKNLSDEAIDKFGKGERLDPEKQKRYDEVKGEISKQVKKQKEKWQPDQFDDIGGGWYEYSHGPYGGQVKLYGTPSEYGINGGRASKLSIDYNGKPLLNYDRGWDTPSGKLELAPEHQEFYNKLLSFLDAYGLD